MESVHFDITKAREEWCLGPDVTRFIGKSPAERTIIDAGTFEVSAKLAAYWLAVAINDAGRRPEADEKAFEFGIDGVNLYTDHGIHLDTLQKDAAIHKDSRRFYYSSVRVRELDPEIGLLRPDIIQVLSIDSSIITITTLFTLDGTPDVCTVVYRQDDQGLAPEAIWVDSYTHSLDEPLDIPSTEFSLKALPMQNIGSIRDLITLSPLLLFQPAKMVE